MISCKASNLEFVDLFCGAGGLSLGLQQAGLTARLGVDACADAIRTYARNFPDAGASHADIDAVTPQFIRSHIRARTRYVLAGCPPCQLFSRLHRSTSTASKKHVIFRYLSLVAQCDADYLVFENVPRITSFDSVWPMVIRSLRKSGYHLWCGTIMARDLGVPQKRTRLVVIGSKVPFEAPEPPSSIEPRTVRDAIHDLVSLEAPVANHTTMTLSRQNLARIRRIKREGGKSRPNARSFSDSYARMSWDDAAPTITTRCISFSNGRFGHPTEHRAVTVREAARLQGFPDEFVFDGTLWQTARQVGNAVPPPIGRWLGEAILAIDSARPRRGRVVKVDDAVISPHPNAAV